MSHPLACTALSHEQCLVSVWLCWSWSGEQMMIQVVKWCWEWCWEWWWEWWWSWQMMWCWISVLIYRKGHSDSACSCSHGLGNALSVSTTPHTSLSLYSRDTRHVISSHSSPTATPLLDSTGILIWVLGRDLWTLLTCGLSLWPFLVGTLVLGTWFSDPLRPTRDWISHKVSSQPLICIPNESCLPCSSDLVSKSETTFLVSLRSLSLSLVVVAYHRIRNQTTGKPILGTVTNLKDEWQWCWLLYSSVSSNFCFFSSDSLSLLFPLFWFFFSSVFFQVSSASSLKAFMTSTSWWKHFIGRRKLSHPGN